MAGDVIPVILSGGSGARLWPLSRDQYPKQFLRLTGDLSLLQGTARRCADAGYRPPLVVASEAHRFVVAEHFDAIGATPTAILLEPVGRNTAPAIAAAASLLVEQGQGDALMLVLPSDHVIRDAAAWAAAVATAIDPATAGRLVTFGIVPTRPETGFGWIAIGDADPRTSGAFAVDRFVEKPPAALAEHLLAARGHAWNSGMFLFRADALLDELARFEPDMVVAVRAAVAGRRTDLDFVRLAADAFGQAKSMSIDDAVFVRTDTATVVPCAIGWDDVGS